MKLSGVVEVFARNVYGKQAIYPLNRTAELLAELAGVKTFQPQHLRAIRELGLEIQQFPDPQALAALKAGA